MKGEKISAEIIAQIPALLATGRPHIHVAAELGVSDSWLRRAARGLGIGPRKPQRPVGDEERKTILRMFAEGARVMQIARFVNRNHRLVSDLIRKHANGPGCSARLAARPGRSLTPLPATGRITPEIALRGAQTTWLLRTAKKREPLPVGPPPRKCQYPMGDRRPFTFCHEPVKPGYPYCCEHTARCYVNTKPLRLVPQKPKETFEDIKW